MAKKLTKKKNIKNWKKGLQTKAISIEGINSTQMRKGQILT